MIFSQSVHFSISSFLHLFFSQSILFSIYSFLNVFFSQSTLFLIYFFSQSILFSIFSFLYQFFLGSPPYAIFRHPKNREIQHSDVLVKMLKSRVVISILLYLAQFNINKVQLILKIGIKTSVVIKYRFGFGTKVNIVRLNLIHYSPM